MDPEQGDFRPVNAFAYGCRVLAAPAPTTTAPAPAGGPMRVRPGGRAEVGGVVDQDTTWDAAAIDVVDDVTVTAGATLTIAAGAVVRFGGFHQLRILDGDLQAVGTPDQPIMLTSAEPDAWRPDLTRAGAWNGVAFVNVPAARDSSRLRWCVLEHAKALSDDAWLEPTDVGGVLVAGAGGAVRVSGRSPLSVSHCVLRHNLAERGGAIGLHHGARPLLVNNLLYDNHATLRAGAIYISYADAVLVHNTLVGNDVNAWSDAVETGCIDHQFARPWYVGNLIWGNTTSYYDNLQIREPKPLNVRYCDVEDWLGGEGCLVADPQLAGFAPAPGSPVVDAARAAVAGVWLPARDLAGQVRRSGVDVDMGAFELADITTAPAPGSVDVRLTCAPNPANPGLRLAYHLPVAGPVRLDIHDLRGRLVRTLVVGPQPAGDHAVRWDGRDGSGRSAPSGVYHCRLATLDGAASRRVTLVR
ncbi:MAG: FlgD immunoglobulin-like domain containing protein [Candidatus Krumholzibacteriia bacterium]